MNGHHHDSGRQVHGKGAGTRRPTGRGATGVRITLGVVAVAAALVVAACSIPTGLLGAEGAGSAVPSSRSVAAPPADSWDSATAVFTDTDGKQTTVEADSVHYCSNVVGDSLTLSESQTVPFEKMQRIEVTRADALTTTDGKAYLTIALRSGQQLSGTVSSNCDFTGANEIGRFSLYPQKLRAIDFRAGSRSGTVPRTTGGGAPAGEADQQLTLGGAISGSVSSATVQCTRTAGASYSWWLTGVLNGSKFELAYNTNNYRGAATYNVTGITDDRGGLMALYFGTVQAASNQATKGTFVIDAGERSGSVSADLGDIRIDGRWRCS